MATFNAVNKMPGVYIQEVDVPGPIAGVSTSIAAFIGPARGGPILEPTRVTSFTQFSKVFGVEDADGNMDPYFASEPVYAPHAVRGFFDNGGATCYFVRVSTAARSTRTLDDRQPVPALVVTAKEEGVAGDGIGVEVQDANLVSGVNAVRAQVSLSSASGNQATLNNAGDAQNFRPGDIVMLEEAATSERATIVGISNVSITFEANLANAYTAAGTMRIADLAPGQTRVRLADTAGIEAGSYVQISQGATNENGVVQAVEPINHFITLTTGLTNTFTMAAADAAVTVDTLEFNLIISTPGQAPQPFNNLSMDPRHSNYVLSVMGAADTSVDVALADPPTNSAPPDNRPAVAIQNLQNGANEDVSQISSADYTQGMARLEEVDEVSILAVPDQANSTVQGAMIAHCENMQDRFAVLDPPAGQGPTEITTHRLLLSSDRGYAALYYPRVVIPNPTGADPQQIVVPPSGHIAGLYARTDDLKGVHKAPANEVLTGVVALERAVTDTDHGLLNESEVNVLRFFRGRGHRVWGARTITTGTQWRYVNVRRLLLFIEESIQEGTEFAVFEPNNQALWETVKRQVSGFLTRVWRSGALVGAKPEEAFRVRIDDELNPPETRALGQLIIEVRVAPTTPAEFIVFQIISEPGKKIVNE